MCTQSGQCVQVEVILFLILHGFYLKRCQYFRMEEVRVCHENKNLPNKFSIYNESKGKIE